MVVKELSAGRGRWVLVGERPSGNRSPQAWKGLLGLDIFADVFRAPANCAITLPADLMIRPRPEDDGQGGGKRWPSKAGEGKKPLLASDHTRLCHSHAGSARRVRREPTSTRGGLLRAPLRVACLGTSAVLLGNICLELRMGIRCIESLFWEFGACPSFPFEPHISLATLWGGRFQDGFTGSRVASLGPNKWFETFDRPARNICGMGDDDALLGSA